MANRITLRHGSTAPSASNLLPYELGWDENTLGLYIGQDGAAPLLISSGGGNVTGVRGSAEQEYRHGNVIISAADVGAATSGHTHALSLDADTGTSSITLNASSRYKITAGGSTYIFTTPPNTWNALSTSQAGYVAQAPNDTGKFLRGDATWAAVTASNVGLGNVENTKLSTWSGSSNITTIGTISSGTVPLANVSGADDIKAIEALTGTSGLLKKTAANTWALDTTAYTTNTGTVTKVTAGTGLSIGTTAGGNFTTTGTINHTNSVTVQTTQALYPIKIDACGHISAYGTAVTSLPASDVYDWAKASTKPSYTASEVGLGNVSNNANLNSTTGAKGDIIYWSAANTPAHLTNTSSTTKKFLSITSQVPSWTTLSKSDVGLDNVENTKLSTWAGSSSITTLGNISTGTIPWAILDNVPSSFTPASHSHGNIANGGTITSTTVALANGDMLLFSDSSNSGKIERSSITIGTGTNTYLRNDGTWATPSDTDTKVKQSGSTTASWRKILLHYTADNTSTTAVTTTTNEIYAAVGISVQPSTGTLRASVYNVNDNATIQYNSTNGCLEIIV